MISIDAPYTTADSPQQLARIGSVSSLERDRLKVRRAIALEGYIAPESRRLSAIYYIAASVCAVATAAVLIFTDAPSETQALHASAQSLRDAQAQAAAETRRVRAR